MMGIQGSLIAHPMRAGGADVVCDPRALSPAARLALVEAANGALAAYDASAGMPAEIARKVQLEAMTRLRLALHRAGVLPEGGRR